MVKLLEYKMNEEWLRSLDLFCLEKRIPRYSGAMLIYLAIISIHFLLTDSLV